METALQFFSFWSGGYVSQVAARRMSAAGTVDSGHNTEISSFTATTRAHKNRRLE